MSIEELERLQKKARNTAIYCILFTIIISCGVYYYFHSIQAIIWSILICFSISIIITKKYSDEFRNSFRDAYALRVYNTFLSNVKYEKTCEIDDVRFIEDLNCFKEHDYFHTSDIVSGTYKDLKYNEEFIDIGTISYDTDNDTHKIEFFAGKWITIEFDKQFKNEIHMYKKGISKIGINSKDENFKNITIGNSEIDNLFRIYTKNDNIDIFNSSFINSLNTLMVDIKYPIIVCTNDNKLHLGINNRSNSFNYSIFKKIDDQEVIDMLSRDYIKIGKFIEEIKNNKSIFK